MCDKKESWDRLRAQAWLTSPQIAAGNDATCKFQALSDGNGTYVYDEYTVTAKAMPPGLPPEQYLLEIARDPNGAVNLGEFNTINVFTKRTKTDPAIGDIYDIDIIGPDNGSIVLVGLSRGFGATGGDSWFDIATVDCDKYGTHPESGAREFGFQYVASGVMYYTRGVSSPSSKASGWVGSYPQRRGWIKMMTGIAGEIQRRGGQASAATITEEKVSKTS